MSRRDEVVNLRKAGLTYAEIGKRVGGISKERVRQILKGNPKASSRPKTMLTTSEVGQVLGIHVNTVRRWNNKGILRAYRISARGDRRFRRQDIEKFLEEGGEA
ncbi:hypothetical protein ES703_73696 [subsurface metagenome]